MYDLIFNDTGIVSPDTLSIKSSVQSLFLKALGSDLSLDDSTPQGQLITSLTNIISNKNAQMMYVINQFNPSNADKQWQDAIAQLYFLERKKATSTTVQCICTGLEGTVLPGIDTSSEPAQAITQNGEIFSNTTTKTIPKTGQITLTFQANETGNIIVAPNTLNRIYTQVAGWDSINNETSGFVGSPEENRIDFEMRRRNSLALYSTGSRDSVYSKVYNINGVNDLSVVENDTSDTKVIKGVSLTRNSIYVVVNGGEDEDIAKAIYEGKSGGCATNGNVEVMLNGLYIPIKFDRPQNIDVFLSVTVNSFTDDVENLENLIKNAIISNFNGTDGSDRINIGETIYASRFYPVLINLGLSVVSVKISKTNGNYSDFLEFNLNQLPVINPQNIMINQ